MAAPRKGCLSSPYVRFRCGKRLSDIINLYIESANIDDQLRAEVALLLRIDEPLVPFHVIKNAHEFFKSQDDYDGVALHTLLETSEMVLPTPITPERNLELEKRIRRLKADQANKEYEAMTANVSFSSRNNETFSGLGADAKELRKPLIAIFNVVLTLAGSFLFFYKAIEYSLPVDDIPKQVFGALMGTLIVAIAELYFLLKLV